MGKTITADSRDLEYLETVLKLIELTQRGLVTWTSVRGIMLDRLAEVVNTPEMEAVFAESFEFDAHEVAEFRHRLREALASYLGYKAEYGGKSFRLYRDRHSENRFKRRARLDVEDSQGQTTETFPQSAALDDLLRTVEQRTKSAQASRMEAKQD